MVREVHSALRGMLPARGMSTWRCCCILLEVCSADNITQHSQPKTMMTICPQTQQGRHRIAARASARQMTSFCALAEP